MSYDDNLTGWPTSDEKIETHDIILLVHQSRGVAVNDFYEENLGTTISFQRPFVIIRFNRVDERQPYFYFEKIGSGRLSNEILDTNLRTGIPVPMKKLADLYSVVKIYDAEPPLAYLLFIIWEHIVNNHALEDDRYPKLRKNQKLDVILEVDTVVKELHESFSFASVFPDSSPRQPRIPNRKWVIKGCDKLVELREAVWENAERTIVRFYFKKYEELINHFVELCARGLPHPGQKRLEGILGEPSEG
jgi:hypothetical protein